ncbi:MAG: hypothetical protein U0166_27375 [Acidobacteriota bacterium]
MSIAIYVLEESIADFAGAVITVAPDGSGVCFDGPHIHESSDAESSRIAAHQKPVLILGDDAPSFEGALHEIRRILREIAIPIVSTKPIENSDGIEIRSFMVYKDPKVGILVPKILSGLRLGPAGAIRCEQGAHLVLKRLSYLFCPLDGTPLTYDFSVQVYDTFLKRKFRVSEVRVEEPGARKTCDTHPDLRFPNAFSRCPRCAADLKPLARKGKGR